MTIDFEQKVNTKRKLIAKHEKELKELLQSCNHEGHVVQRSSYYEGSYYDKAFIRYWNECTLCGALSETTYVYHNHYG